MIERNIGNNKTKARRMHKAQGAESNLSFIQLANEAREPDTNRGLMEGKNFSQQAMLTQGFPFASLRSPLYSEGSFSSKDKQDTLIFTLSRCFLSGSEIIKTEGETRSIAYPQQERTD